mgnify:FL=1|tara:strand:- start:473 stop:889 length:417 start_codon:yes stop_codon:yes gene_type:complete
MKIKKTVGFASEGDHRKSYTIHTECGHEFIAKANGRNAGYRCEGLFYGSVKELKTAIESGVAPREIACKDERIAADAADDNKSPMWDCIDPCALLIRLGPPVLGHEALETLGNYGWLTEDGLPDRERVEKEFKRVLGQ